MGEISSWFVVLMGIGTVFVGLICIVLICSLLGYILKKQDKSVQKEPNERSLVNQQETIAVMAAAIAAYTKKDPACIRIQSIKKVQ